MSVQLQMFDPKTFDDSPSVTSSPALAAGRELCASPDGQMNATSGPAPAHASRLALLDEEWERLTKDTCGRISETSSASAALNASLGSRLRARLACYGSLEYKLTWKEQAMPSGGPLLQQQVSGRRTSDDEFTGWPTTRAEDSEQTGSHRGNPDTLNSASKLSGWATTNAHDGSGPGLDLTSTHGGNLQRDAALAGWATPRQSDAKCGAHYTPNMKGKDLAKDATLVSGLTLPGTDAQTANSDASRAKLNPHFSAWLMGYPVQWTVCGLRAAIRYVTKKKSLRARRSSKATETPSCQS